MKTIIDIINEMSEQEESAWFGGIKRIKSSQTFKDCCKAYGLLARKYIPDFDFMQNRMVYENLVKWLIADETMQQYNETGNWIPADLTKGIYLFGSTGTGKTSAMHILRALQHHLSIMVYIHGKMKPLSLISNHAVSICEEYAKTGDLSRFLDSDVLFIQDMGTEPTDVLYMGNRVQVIRNIIEMRGDDDRKMTIITSNLPPFGKNIVEKYGDRVQSRLKAMCNFLYVGGEDKRH